MNSYAAVHVKYDKIKNMILKEIASNCTKEKLQIILQNYLGKYYDYTEGLYYEILCVYITKILHKKPDPDLISYLLSWAKISLILYLAIYWRRSWPSKTNNKEKDNLWKIK